MTYTPFSLPALTNPSFFALFNDPWNFLIGDIQGDYSVEWETETRYPLEPRVFEREFHAKDRILGVRFSSTTNRLVFDIDTKSPYHPSQDSEGIRHLMGELEDIGITSYIVVQSSYSGGVHVYTFFSSPLPTFNLAYTVDRLLRRARYEVSAGKLEIFPNPKAYRAEGKPSLYKGHRVPLQEGSFILDGNYFPYSSSPEEFVRLADICAVSNDTTLLEGAIASAMEVRASWRMRGNPKNVHAWEHDLLTLMEGGWTDYGQTNDLLRVIGTHGRVFRGLSGESLTHYIEETATRLPGYERYCRHKPQIWTRARDWARCVEKFYYPYGSHPTRKGTFLRMTKGASTTNARNDERSVSARERIEKGYEYLLSTMSHLPTRIREVKEALLNAIESLFGVRPSDRTFTKYAFLWHPKHRSLIEENVSYSLLDTTDERHREPLQEEPDKKLPDPLFVVREHEETQEAPKPLPSENLKKIALPPLYMKVCAWAKSHVKLLYSGNLVSGLIEDEGKRYPQLHTLLPQTEVKITSTEHSSFLFRPEDEENLQVYVCPILEDWKGEGISVRAIALQPLNDKDILYPHHSRAESDGDKKFLSKKEDYCSHHYKEKPFS